MLYNSRFIMTFVVALLMAIGGFGLLVMLLGYWEKRDRQAAVKRRLKNKD